MLQKCILREICFETNAGRHFRLLVRCVRCLSLSIIFKLFSVPIVYALKIIHVIIEPLINPRPVLGAIIKAKALQLKITFLLISDQKLWLESCLGKVLLLCCNNIFKGRFILKTMLGATFF